MADENEENEEEEEGGGGGKKKIIMIVGVLAALGGVYNFVLKGPPPVEEELTPEEMAAALEPVEGEIYQMEEMILNIQGEAGSGTFLRIGLAMVLEEGVLVADFEMQEAIAKDISVQYLSSIESETLRTAEGRQSAKDELAILVREGYGDAMVVRVLFTSLVMQ